MLTGPVRAQAAGLAAVSFPEIRPMSDPLLLARDVGPELMPVTITIPEESET